jgi:hypothetical protein
MVEPLQLTFIFYFLVIPMVIGVGIDLKLRNKYPFGASCGVIFYFICAAWMYFGISLEHGILEPVLIMIAVSSSIFIIGFSYEHKISQSIFRRHAVVLLAVSISGLPLIGIRAIIQGEMGFTYPASALPLFQFTLAVVGLVVLANVMEALLYSKNEGMDEKSVKKDEDLTSMKFRDMDEMIIEREFYTPKEDRIPGPRPDVAVMDMNFENEDFHRK